MESNSTLISFIDDIFFKRVLTGNSQFPFFGALKLHQIYEFDKLINWLKKKKKKGKYRPHVTLNVTNVISSQNMAFRVQAKCKYKKSSTFLACGGGLS